MDVVNRKIIQTKHAMRRKTTFRALAKVQQDEGNPVLYVDVLQGRRLTKDEKGCNPFCEIEFEGLECYTDIVWKNHNPRWNEFFLYQVNSKSSKLTITVWSKGVLKKDVFLGRVSFTVKDFENEEIQNKWFPLQKSPDFPNAEVNGHILLKLQYSVSDKGKMHKLKEMIDIDHYDSLQQFFIEQSVQNFCLLFDNNKLVPNQREINSITNLILGTEEIPTSKILRFIITAEVNNNERYATLFRRNSLASKLTSSCMNRFGQEYLKGLLEAFIYNLCLKDQRLEVDPHKTGPKDNVEENMRIILELCEGLVEKICKSVKDLPYEIRELAYILASSVEAKFKDKKVVRLAVGGIIFLRFICPALTSPLLYGIVKENPSENVRRTLMIITKVLQNLANGVPFGVKEKFMIPANKAIEKQQENVNKMLLEIVDLSGLQPTTTLDKQKQVSFYSAMKVTEEDVRMLFSLYNIHRYFHRNIAVIKQGAMEPKPPVSLPIEDKKSFIEAVEKLEKVLKELGPPTEIKLDNEKFAKV